MTTGRLVGGIVALALGGAVLTTPTADGTAASTEAERAAVRTTVRIVGSTLTPGFPDPVPVKGTVASPRSGCEVGRLVVIRPAAGGAPVGRDRTNRFGQWQIQVPSAQAYSFFEATAPRARPRRGLVCGAGSDTGQPFLPLP